MPLALAAALTTPLLFDPGERWNYGINIDWVGKMVEAVSGNYFSMLGITPAAGRFFLPGEAEKPNADPIAILTTSVMAAPCGLYLSKLLLPKRFLLTGPIGGGQRLVSAASVSGSSGPGWSLIAKPRPKAQTPAAPSSPRRPV